ncbi:MAG: glutamine amidotransferase [Oscillospiraceae bacterium]|nr:glutamine amidotransferase [Oscillospiraceae bacterium]
MELKICHLYPDVMNLSGDRGNVICMEKRLAWRGIDVVTTGITIGENLQASDFDLFFLGNGQPFEQALLLQDLAGEKAAQLKSAAADGLPILAICGGYQLLGNSYETADGTILDGAGVLDVQTKCVGKRLVGDYAFTCEELGETIVGFENHAGKTWLGSAVKPFGAAVPGHGNNGEDGTEGARYNNVFASYAHGCLLPKNPKLCDHILKIALERKYGSAELAPLDDTLELTAHAYVETKLEK